MKGRWGFLFLCAILAPACGGGGGGGGGGTPVAFAGVGVAEIPIDPANPADAPKPIPFTQVQLGIANFDLTWPTTAISGGIPFGLRSQYLSGGVNTGTGWTTWNSPPGQFALLYMNASDSAGMIPVLDYYQLRGSAPNVGSENPDPKLQNPSTMSAYYAEFKLLLGKCAVFGKPVIIHVEPDFWGFCQQNHGSLPQNIPVSVANTGLPEAAGLNDTLCGFARLLVRLRDGIAPNAFIALHASHWGAGPDLIKNHVDPITQATAIAGFFTRLGAKFDLLFHDPGDRDAGYYQYVVGDGGASWWVVPDDFNRYQAYLLNMEQLTARKNVLWQVPLGNTKMKTCGIVDWHYQDNRVEYWLDDTAHTNLTTYANAGVVAILWGAPQDKTTHYDDASGDGVTNSGLGATISTVSDDDGGYFRMKADAYYHPAGGNPGPVAIP
jgi:hypothetical protein